MLTKENFTSNIEVLKKLNQARQIISDQSLKKDGKNDYAKYNYFTPATVTRIVADACKQVGLMTFFEFENMLEDRIFYNATLHIIDLETKQAIPFTVTMEKAEIKGTSETQKIAGTMTYAERYLKQFAFEIAENDLDLDANKDHDYISKKKYMAEKDYNEIISLFDAGDIDKAVALKNTLNHIPDKLKPGLIDAYKKANQKVDKEVNNTLNL